MHLFSLIDHKLRVGGGRKKIDFLEYIFVFSNIFPIIKNKINTCTFLFYNLFSFAALFRVPRETESKVQQY